MEREHGTLCGKWLDGEKDTSVLGRSDARFGAAAPRGNAGRPEPADELEGIRTVAYINEA